MVKHGKFDGGIQQAKGTNQIHVFQQGQLSKHTVEEKMQVAKLWVVCDAIYVKEPPQTQYMLYRFVYK